MILYDRKHNPVVCLDPDSGYLSVMGTASDKETEYLKDRLEHIRSLSIRGMRDLFFWFFAAGMVSLVGSFDRFGVFVSVSSCFMSYVSLVLRVFATVYFFFIWRKSSPLLFLTMMQAGYVIVCMFIPKAVSGIEFAVLYWFAAMFVLAIIIALRGNLVILLTGNSGKNKKVVFSDKKFENKGWIFATLLIIAFACFAIYGMEASKIGFMVSEADLTKLNNENFLAWGVLILRITISLQYLFAGLFLQKVWERREKAS